MPESPVEPPEARPAATLMLLRACPDEDSGSLEVLMMRRSPEARVMPGIWVFPGGGVDRADFADAADDDAAYELAARRELAEESGIVLGDGHEMRPWSRWVTPAEVPVRFDTRFFVAEAPADCVPAPDGTEMTESRWIAPPDALAAYEAGTLDLIFPTIMHLLMLARHASVEEALAAAPAEPPAPVQPEIVTRADEVRILLEGVEYELPRTASVELGTRD